MQKLESEADSLFVKLMTQNSKSQAVLREYAQYLRNVKMNNEEAARFEAKADQLESGEGNGRNKRGQDASSHSRGSTSDIQNHLDDSDLSTQAK